MRGDLDTERDELLSELDWLSVSELLDESELLELDELLLLDEDDEDDEDDDDERFFAITLLLLRTGVGECVFSRCFSSTFTAFCSPSGVPSTDCFVEFGGSAFDVAFGSFAVSDRTGDETC